LESPVASELAGQFGQLGGLEPEMCRKTSSAPKKLERLQAVRIGTAPAKD
jgi:hypothetical protein